MEPKTSIEDLRDGVTGADPPQTGPPEDSFGSPSRIHLRTERKAASQAQPLHSVGESRSREGSPPLRADSHSRTGPVPATKAGPPPAGPAPAIPPHKRSRSRNGRRICRTRFQQREGPPEKSRAHPGKACK